MLQVLASTPRTRVGRPTVEPVDGIVFVDLTDGCGCKNCRCCDMFARLPGRWTDIDTAEIIEHDISRQDYRSIFRDSLYWESPTSADLVADGLLRAAAYWPVGTIVVPRGDELLAESMPGDETGVHAAEVLFDAIGHAYADATRVQLVNEQSGLRLLQVTDETAWPAKALGNHTASGYRRVEDAILDAAHAYAKALYGERGNWPTHIVSLKPDARS